MEASDSSRSPLGIDLNEIPSATTSSSETTTLCGACGGAAEAAGDVVVCDACERGFHLDCAGILMCCHEQQQQPYHHNLLEWVCADCVKNGAKSKLWPLGRKRRILDMNASPPSDVDADATDEVLDFRYPCFFLFIYKKIYNNNFDLWIVILCFMHKR